MKIIQKVKLFALSAGLLIASCATLIGFNTQNASAATCTSYVYRQSSAYSSCIKYIQTILNGAADNPTTCNGYREPTTRITVDGYFGSNTANRVKTFQRAHCLTYDGIVGSQTWGALCNEARSSGYIISGPGWYSSSDAHDRIDLATYKAGVYAGCGNSWPKLMYY